MSVCRQCQSVPPLPPPRPIQCDPSTRSAVVVPVDIAVVVLVSAGTVVVSVAVSVASVDTVAFVEAVLGIAMLDCMDTRTSSSPLDNIVAVKRIAKTPTKCQKNDKKTTYHICDRWSVKYGDFAVLGGRVILPLSFRRPPPILL